MKISYGDVDVAKQLHEKKGQKYLQNANDTRSLEYCIPRIKQIQDIQTSPKLQDVMITILLVIEEAGHHVMKKGICVFEVPFDIAVNETLSGTKVHFEYFRGKSEIELLEWWCETIRHVYFTLTKLQRSLRQVIHEYPELWHCYTPQVEYVSMYLDEMTKFGKKLFDCQKDIGKITISLNEKPSISPWFPDTF